jgi:hypothetical protein
MSTNVTHLADNVRGALLSEILVVSVNGDLAVDLADPANRPPGETYAAKTYWFGTYVTIEADGGDVYYAFSAATGTVDPTATGIGGQQCVSIKDGAREQALIPNAPPAHVDGVTDVPNAWRWLLLHSTAAIRVRIWRSSVKV